MVVADVTADGSNEATLTIEPPLITALANDYGYENWVAKAIQYYVKPQDRVIFIIFEPSWFEDFKEIQKIAKKYEINLGWDL